MSINLGKHLWCVVVVVVFAITAAALVTNCVDFPAKLAGALDFYVTTLPTFLTAFKKGLMKGPVNRVYLEQV